MSAAFSFVWFVSGVLRHGPSALYPFRGAQYFLTRPQLWGNLLLLAVPQLLLTATVTVIAFAFLYPPQAALAFVLNGPAGLFGAGISMFQQSMGITRGMSELFLFPRPLRILFDSVLVQEGWDSLILVGRRQTPPQRDESDFLRVGGWMKTLPRKVLFPTWFFMVLFRFFLGFIPILGPIVLIVLDAPGTSQRCLGRYFELKGWDRPRVDAFVSDHRSSYMAFGLIAATLESVPFIGFAFAFTNTAGGALWAVRIEERAQKPNQRRRGLRLFG